MCKYYIITCIARFYYHNYEYVNYDYVNTRITGIARIFVHGRIEARKHLRIFNKAFLLFDAQLYAVKCHTARVSVFARVDSYIKRAHI